jgi:hypothetical protein
MSHSLFRKKNLDRVSSPEQLGDFLHVTSPSVWIVLAAVIVLLASLFVWSAVTSVESYASGTAEVRGGVLTFRFDEAGRSEHVEAGMDIQVGELVTPVASVGHDERGDLIAIANIDLPDGDYPARVRYRSTQILRMLFA